MYVHNFNFFLKNEATYLNTACGICLYVFHTAHWRSDHLLKASIQFIEFDRCKRNYEGSDLYSKSLSSDKLICAGDLEKGKDTCQVRQWDYKFHF